MPFHLWPGQVHVMWLLMTVRLVIILKARQLGISWVSCAYALWLVLFHPGKVVICFSKGENEAKELLRRIQALYDRLPEWMREQLPRQLKDNAGELAWSNESRVMSLAASANAGRSFTASLVIMDEAAFMTFAGKIYAALKPTIDGGGQLVMLSTANGLGNLYHLLWTRAVAGLSGFTPIFLPWWTRPGRSQQWYEAQKSEYTDPQIVKQEYPANANEAFLASGRARFHPDWISAQAANVRAGSPGTSTLTHIPGLKIYQPPQPGRMYLIVADVSEGLDHGDWSNAVVVDRRTGEEVATIRGLWEPDVYADYLHAIGTAYNRCEIAVERNNHGHTVLATLKRAGYPRITLGDDGRPGWLTSTASKPQMIDALAEALRDTLITVRTQAALDEMQIYTTLANGKTSAPDGYHDDYVMSWAIYAIIRRRPLTPPTPIAGGQRTTVNSFKVR